MRACVLHAAEDLRIEDRPTLDLAPQEVRVRVRVRGAFRFGEVFGDAVTRLEKRLIDIRPLLTAKMPMESARKPSPPRATAART